MTNNLALATSRPWLCSARGGSPVPSWGGSFCGTHTSSALRNTSNPGRAHAYSRLPAEDATKRSGKEFMEGRRARAQTHTHTHTHTPGALPVASQSSRLEDVIASELSLLSKMANESKRLGKLGVTHLFVLPVFVRRVLDTYWILTYSTWPPACASLSLSAPLGPE